MTTITYRIVEHDGGWAYRLGDVFSETFGTHDQALAAARRAAAEQEVDEVRIEDDRNARQTSADDQAPSDDPQLELPDMGQQVSADTDLPSGVDKVDMTMHANAIVDANHDAPQADAIDRKQQERLEERAETSPEKETEEELDEGLADTFPASDPVSAEQPTRTGAPGEFAKKKKRD